MPQQQGISLAQAAQGGIIDDIDVEIIDAAFCQYDYQGNLDHEILALAIQYQDEAGKTYDQYYSAGELIYFVPSDDGSMAVPVADKQMLADSSNAWKFLASLIEVGFPVEMLESGNVKKFVGMKVHVKQHAQPKRQGLIRGGKNADREPTVLLVTSILSMPGETPAKKPAGKPAAQTAARPGLGAKAGQPVGARPAPAAPAKPGLGAKTAAKGPVKPNGQAGPSTPAGASEDDKLIATDMLNGILIEAGGSITKKDLSKLAFQAAGALVEAGAIEAKAKMKYVQLVFQDAFLHELAQSQLIVFDGANVSLPEAA